MQPGLSCCSLLVIWAHVAVEIQGSSSPEEHCPLLSCSSLMYLWFFWGSVLWGLSCEKMGELRQTAFSMLLGWVGVSLRPWHIPASGLGCGRDCHIPIDITRGGVVGKPWNPHQQIENQHPGSPQSSKSKSSFANHPKVHQAPGEGQSRLQCRAWPSSDAREREGGDVRRNKWPHLAAQFPSLPAGISCLLEQGTKCWMLPCLPPANKICEQPLGPALWHHPAQWVFWV